MREHRERGTREEKVIVGEEYQVTVGKDQEREKNKRENQRDRGEKIIKGKRRENQTERGEKIREGKKQDYNSKHPMPYLTRSGPR
jgi:hypothetical protein